MAAEIGGNMKILVDELPTKEEECIFCSEKYGSCMIRTGFKSTQEFHGISPCLLKTYSRCPFLKEIR